MSTHVMSKVCIYGAGAIGGNLAARLARSGADVSVVARGAHLDAIRQNGITLESPKETIAARVKASADPRDLGPQDLVIVTVKAPALPDVAAGIGPLLEPETPVMFVMNGIPWWYFYRHGGPYDGRRLPRIDPGDAVWTAVGPQRAIGAVIYSANSVPRPGVVHNSNARADLIIGEPSDELTERVQNIAALINASSATATISPRIRDDVWNKLLGNMSSNPLTFLAQCSIKDMFAEPVCVAALRRIAEEAASIGRALGCNAHLDVDMAFGRNPSAHKPSIVQDLERGRPVELDAMFTVPLEFAKMLNVPAPTLELLVALMTLRARGAGLYKA